MRRYGDPHAVKWRAPRGARYLISALLAALALFSGVSVFKWASHPADPDAIRGLVALASFVALVSAGLIAWAVFWSPLKRAVSRRSIANGSPTFGGWVPSGFRTRTLTVAQDGSNSADLPKFLVFEFSEDELVVRSGEPPFSKLLKASRSAVISVEAVEFVDRGTAFDGMAISTSSETLVFQPVVFGRFGAFFLEEKGIVQLIGSLPPGARDTISE